MAFHCTTCGEELPDAFDSDGICSVCLNRKIILAMLRCDGIVE